MITTIIRLMHQVTSWCFIVTFTAVREHQFLQDHLPAGMLFLFHHSHEMTPLLAGRQAGWVGIAPQSCSASREAQAVAWFGVMEMKDKNKCYQEGGKRRAVSYSSSATAAESKSAPLQLPFPGQSLTCVLTDGGV